MKARRNEKANDVTEESALLAEHLRLGLQAREEE